MDTDETICRGITMYTIYVPSKNRTATFTNGCVKFLRDHNVPHILVIEPQDVEQYLQAGADKNALLVLDKNDQGESYARNFIFKTSEAKGEPWHWQINDDVYGFQHRLPKYTKDITPQVALGIMEREARKYHNVVCIGPEANYFPPSGRIKNHGLPSECYLFKKGHGAKFSHIPGFEDITYQLAVLDTGQCILAMDSIRRKAPATGSNEGGHHETDRGPGLLILKKRWPHVVFNEGGWPGGRINMRWARKFYKQTPVPK